MRQGMRTAQGMRKALRALEAQRTGELLRSLEARRLVVGLRDAEGRELWFPTGKGRAEVRAAASPAPRRPDGHKSSDQESVNPYLFVVGVPRSGTTLLQRLLDAHPQLSVINEAYCL